MSKVNQACQHRRFSLRLTLAAAFFGGDAASWLNLQQACDLNITEAKVAKLMAKQVQPLEHA